VLITTGYQGWVARNSEQHQLRAYVGLIPGDIDNFGDPKLQKFEFVRKNYGQTPAYDVLVTEFGQSVVGFGQPIPGNPIKIEGEILRGNFTLFPSGELRMDLLGLGVNPTLVDRVDKDENLRFVYLGTIKYRDAFDTTHYTNFCWMYKAKDFVGKHADWCLSHNDSD
jgi:hypothetical protein